LFSIEREGNKRLLYLKVDRVSRFGLLLLSGTCFDYGLANPEGLKQAVVTVKIRLLFLEDCF
jgi:hypothetical protein